MATVNVRNATRGDIKISKIGVESKTRQQLDAEFREFKSSVRKDYEYYTGRPFPSQVSPKGGMLAKLLNALLASLEQDQKRARHKIKP